MSIFPFFISYQNVSNWIYEITNGIATDTETTMICFILINFINIWFIITILKLIITTISKIIKTIIGG